MHIRVNHTKSALNTALQIQISMNRLSIWFKKNHTRIKHAKLQKYLFNIHRLTNFVINRIEIYKGIQIKLNQAHISVSSLYLL